MSSKNTFSISVTVGVIAFCFLLPAVGHTAASIPDEPIIIGSEPQFLHDSYIADNFWAIRYKRQAVQRVFYQPRKHADNPILTRDQPSYLWVVRDEAAGLFRMYYQANI
jgi:ABC-type glycerol-3-phosphate transport system permease component